MPLPAPHTRHQVQAAFIGVLAVAGVLSLGMGTWFAANDMLVTAQVRAFGLGAAALVLAVLVWRTGRLAVATHTILVLIWVGILSSVLERGATSSMLPLLVTACPLATTTVGQRAGRFWLVANLSLLGVAAAFNPGTNPALENSLLVTTSIAAGIAGVVSLAFHAITTGQRRHLRAANAALVEKETAAHAANAAKTTFLATMSHEIRTPLNAVIGLAELLGDRPLPAEDLVRVRQIQQSGGLLLALLNDVLDLSRIESGATELAVEPTDVGALLDQLVRALTPRSAQHGVALRLAVSPDLPPALALDPTRLRQIVVNLLGNALKFTHHGRVEVRAERASGAAGAGETVLQDALQIDVIDTGVGIPPAAHGQIFERFRQADEGRDRAFGGTGLGLAISRTIARMMGGELVLAASAPGQGSTFRLTLPLRPVAAAAPAPAPADRADIPPGLVVLVVDDDRVNRMVVEAQLRHLGCTTLQASDGAQAVALLTGAPAAPAAQVVLMDQQMPVMDGVRATERLRAAGVGLPIVALTANAFAEDRRACLDAGMDAFLTKPVAREALQATLAQVCRDRGIGPPPPAPQGMP